MVFVENSYSASGLTGEIIGAAMEVHNQLGPGFLESVYEGALTVELELRGIKFQKQTELPVFYKARNVKQFVCDFIVEDKIIVELKAIKQIGEIEKLQVINYLKASGYEIGLLFNFGNKSLEWKRLINTRAIQENLNANDNTNT
ncbi:MAG TPA: GxxExxY protein [Sedimentisphaerales bacterium]|nr:GxxExxY protein [Sedimentisphaerales bacterium]